MWERSLVKSFGKARFKMNFWACVVVALILGILEGGGSGSNLRNMQSSAPTDGQGVSFHINTPELTTEVFIILIIAIALSIFIFVPIVVGCRQFFLANLYTRPAVSSIFAPFNNGNYKNTVITMLMTGIKICLWSLLFIIPGVIKAYSYRMVPYILAENPGMSWSEVQRESREMMNGHKMAAFIYDLSFIGWYILTVLTIGILGIFYVGPYKGSADAALYKAIKGELAA